MPETCTSHQPLSSCKSHSGNCKTDNTVKSTDLLTLTVSRDSSNYAQNRNFCSCFVPAAQSITPSSYCNYPNVCLVFCVPHCLLMFVLLLVKTIRLYLHLWRPWLYACTLCVLCCGEVRRDVCDCLFLGINSRDWRHRCYLTSTEISFSAGNSTFGLKIYNAVRLQMSIFKLHFWAFFVPAYH